MDKKLKKDLQDFLKKYGINAVGVDFDTIRDCESLVEQLGIENELCFMPPELCSGLKLLFEIHRKKFDSSIINDNHMFTWDGTELFMDEFSPEEKLIVDCWSKDRNKYTMGNPGSLQGEKLSEEKLSIKIANDIKFYQASLQGVAVDMTGLKNRLANSQLHFDVKRFDKEKYEDEIEKILYFFYDLEYKRIPYFLDQLKADRKPKKQQYFNLIEFLSKPSTENVDFSFLGWDTHNGRITRFIKYPIKKELGLQKVQDIDDNLDIIAHTWHSRIMDARHVIEQGIKIDFSQEIQRIQSELDLLTESSKDENSPIETLYLKISQFERIGELQDFLKISRHLFNTNYHVPPEFIPQMEEWKHATVQCDRAAEYIEEHLDKIAPYIYLKETITSAERKRIRQNTWKIKVLLDCCIRANSNVIVENEVTILRVISCLQAVLIDNKKKFEYTFSLIDNYFSHPPTDILRKDIRLLDAIQLYWARRVNNHFNANLGEYEIRYALEQYENSIYELWIKLYSYSSISEMREINLKLMSHILPVSLCLIDVAIGKKVL